MSENKEIPGAGPEELYLDLMKQCLTRTLFGDAYRPYLPKKRRRLRRLLAVGLRRILARRSLELVQVVPLDMERRSLGLDQPPDAETMIGLRRLDNLQACITDVLRCGVPGDLIETGVWRGGATIFMRAVLKAYGDPKRNVWVADSFQGLPKPDEAQYPADRGDLHWTKEKLAVPLEVVKSNFARYGLLDDRVCFLPGWFSETLHRAHIEQLAILRLDGDMYESTIESLRALHPKVSVGGYVIIDDYALGGCREAVEDYRKEHGIRDEIEPIDGSSVFWKRLS
jgi:O-methyltransferase